MANLTWEAACLACDGEGTTRRPDGLAMRAARKAAGRSLRSMAAEIGCSVAYLSDVELGRRNGNPEILRAYEAL